METIRYYTDTNKYMSWQKLKSSQHYLEWASWLDSGNKLKIGNKVIQHIKELNNYLIFRHTEIRG